MKALDTNILIRFLVNDDEKQAGAVYKKLKHAEAEKELLFVPILVVLETLWVLESVYEIPRNEILDALDTLLALPTLKFELQPTIRNFVNSSKGNLLDLSDMLIAFSAKTSGCESIITFDKKAAKSEWFELLE
ncbi:MAG: type II toxin-antitoxin system VapC family toxin [Proteobacteria bacterium]|nr:type II toxin-antitoxin system VapC family toxin [Pseudomonadota bacterium]MBU4470945.1 type II toxin-antitoxin system VapC family toxin [Pseudomonadota bacterium]MCG2751432.1 type II toxin-antitoxin system VapC family toxin [Desulfobacteraceae bacterium]